jgi:RuvB-like protein 2
VVTAPDACAQATEVAVEDIQKVYTLFLDEQRSKDFLREYQDQYMFNDADAPAAAAGARMDVS